MGKIYNGNVEWGLIFKPNGAQPLDDRAVVNTATDLQNGETFDAGTVYAGMVVTTADKGEVFVCTDPDGNLWKKVGEDVADAGKVTVAHDEGSLKWTILQGGSSVGDIIIPEDMVVKSGKVVKGTWDSGRNTFTESPEGDDIALKLILNTSSSQPIYIDVKSLIDVYTAGDGLKVLGNKFSIVLSSGNETGYLSVGPDGLKLTGIDAIKTKVTTLEDNYSTLSSKVEGLNTSVTAASGNIEKVATGVGSAEWGVNPENYDWKAPTGKNYINGATSVVDAVNKLDTQLKAGTTDVVASSKSSNELTVTKSDNTYTVELVGVDGGIFE